MFSCEFCIIFKNTAEHLWTTKKEITNIERPNGPVHGNPKRDVGEKMFCEKYPYRVKVRFIPLTFLFVIVTHFSQLRSHCVCYNNTFLVTLVKFIPLTFLFSFYLLIWKIFTGQLPGNAFTCYFGNFLHVTTNPVNGQLMSHQNISMYMYQLRHSKSCRTQRKGRTENSVKMWKILFWCNLRSRNFHIPEIY